ncbi:MAG TPA: acyl-CoA dehydrogenase [Candidatus Competibacteraceae bacterium]|nr:acyl-CoA dehydrogenase [Candidatus Competibacteraceae bacterium]
MSGMLANLRQRLISKPLLAWYGKVLPPMSDTEREALEAGTVWWDADLFSGRPDWDKFLASAKPRLSVAEQAFLDGPVEELCRMLDDWRISEELRDIPPEIWHYIKEQGFLGMIIPQEYGGLGFSALAHSAVVMKISTRSIAAAICVMVPNSLGPGELLLHYGSPRQKNHYLPRLARGEEIPCFGLTGPWAGSDAAAMRDYGVVCWGEHQGKRTLGIRLTWEKRYITLGPVATLLGLAFKLADPQRLLGEQEELGITLALVPADHPGVHIGRRHWPARQAFPNGPNWGKDVFIPLEWVIGERDGIGQGWRMLMDCLAAGRSVSLPSLSTGAARYCARVTGAYARIRKQFKMPIGRFEGVEEALARIAVHAYVLDAARQITCAAVDAGERPSVLSAIVKYHFTERMRQAVNDAMDVHGGKAICDGPSNYLLNGYYALPIGITVEGANILTRSLIIFGQGAIRCHPWLLQEMQAAQAGDLAGFDRALFGHLGLTLRNLGRAIWHGLTGNRFAAAPDAAAPELIGYYRALSRYSAAFALVADCALLILGGELKRREKLSARFGDILSELYLSSCVLKRFEDDGRPAEDLPLVHAACQQSLYTIERRFDDILANFPAAVLGGLLRRLAFPWGLCRRQPSDRLGQQCAGLLLSPSAARDRLTSGIFIGQGAEDVTGCLEYALDRVLAAEAAEHRLRAADFDGTPREALQAGLINEVEAQLLAEAERATYRVIRVDDFDAAELSRRQSARPGRSQAVSG